MTPSKKEAFPPYFQWQTVTSLVGSLQARCIVAYAENVAMCRETVEYCLRNRLNVCLRGGGYSYGDAILNDDNVILDISGMDNILDFDPGMARITVEPGVRLIDIFRNVLHHRLALASVPSESTITVAGAIGTNVNGKDGWRMGNFGDQVVSLKLMLASGEIIEVSRDENADVFRAVVGGLGLLGVILQATLALRTIPSPFLEIRRTPVVNVDDLLQHLAEVEENCDFAVAWIDTCVRGSKLGRAVVHATSWVASDATTLQLKEQVDASLYRLESRLRQARNLSPFTEVIVTAMLQMQKISVRLFNSFYFHYSRLRHRLHTADNVESFLRYNFDASFIIPSATAVCGPRGYTIQLTFPRTDAHAAISEIIHLCQDSPCLPPKLILRLHRQDDHLISFSEDGYSLNLELHPKPRHVQRMNLFVEQLIERVIAHGGKVHLAKDHVLNRDQFTRLFPQFTEFMEMKRRLDPGELFQSDMYRRLLRDPVTPDGDPEISTG